MIVEPEGVKKMKKLKLAIIFAEIIIVEKDAKLFSSYVDDATVILYSYMYGRRQEKCMNN